MLLPWAAQAQTAAAPVLMSPSQEFLSQPVTALPGFLAALCACSVTQHLLFSGDSKTKCCLSGFLISEQLGGPEVPHSVAIQGFLPGWLGPSSSIFFLKVDSLGNTDLHMCPHTGILGNTES